MICILYHYFTNWSFLNIIMYFFFLIKQGCRRPSSPAAGPQYGDCNPGSGQLPHPLPGRARQQQLLQQSGRGPRPGLPPALRRCLLLLVLPDPGHGCPSPTTAAVSRPRRSLVHERGLRVFFRPGEACDPAGRGAVPGPALGVRSDGSRLPAEAAGGTQSAGIVPRLTALSGDVVPLCGGPAGAEALPVPGQELPAGQWRAGATHPDPGPGEWTR